MSRYYVLEGNRPVRVASLARWTSWFFNAEREVAATTLADGTRITTEFYGVDPGATQAPASPLLFETRTFAPGGAAGAGRRYASWAVARIGHMDVVHRRIRRFS